MIDKVKSHISRHKVAYSFGSGVAFAGITCIIMRGRGASLGVCRAGGTGLHSGSVFVRPLFLFSNHNKINVVAVVLRDGRGHPGYPVMCKETGDLFLSQTGAARWAGISDWYMSQHLRGNLPHVQGWTFERVAAIPAVAA